MFCRIRDRLIGLGVYLPILDAGAISIAATTTWRYAEAHRLARTEPAAADIAAELHSIARDACAAVLALPQSRRHAWPLDADGADAELMTLLEGPARPVEAIA